MPLELPLQTKTHAGTLVAPSLFQFKSERGRNQKRDLEASQKGMDPP